MTKEQAKAIYYPISGINLSGEKDLIDLIYDSFENRSCDNCKHIKKYNKELWDCKKDVKTSYFTNFIEHNFSCNKWESK